MRTLYGPVRSWRFGRSLGIDPLASREKRCPLSCVYCQYGPTLERSTRPQPFVPARRLLADLKELGPVDADWMTFAGLGEPTLAANLGELLDTARTRLSLPAMLFTGGALLPDAGVRRRVLGFDAIVVKLDAPNQELFGQINRPAPGIRWAAVFEGLHRLRKAYGGRLILEIMFVQANRRAASALADLARELSPDEVQLNTPLQPALGGPVSAAEMDEIRVSFEDLPVACIYQNGQPRCSPRAL